MSNKRAMTHEEIYNQIIIDRAEILSELEQAVMMNEAKRIREEISAKMVEVVDVIDYVCKVRGVTRISMDGKTRKLESTKARQIVWWLLKNRVIPNNLSLSALGALFNRDHSTAHHGIKTINEILSVDAYLREGLMMAANHFGTPTDWNPTTRELTIGRSVYEDLAERHALTTN